MERSAIILVLGPLLVGSCVSERSAPAEPTTKAADVKWVHFAASLPEKTEPLLERPPVEEREEFAGEYELVAETYPLVPDYRLVGPAPTEYAVLAEYPLLPNTRELVGDVYEMVPDSYDLLR